MAPVLPERLGAGSYVSLSVSYLVGRGGNAASTYVLGEPNNGGWGAGPDADGQNGLIAATDGDTYNLPVEVVESRFPVRVERYALDAPTAAGAGRHRGGLGVVRTYRVLDPDGAVSFGSFGGWRRRPWGLGGGQEGSTNHLRYEDGAAGRVTRRELAAGETVTMVTAAGGGFGDPRDRDPALVHADLLDGYITERIAREVYGAG
jgi:N-methylhydantoinase B